MEDISFYDLVGCFISERVLRGRGYYSQSGKNALPGIENEGNTWCKMLATTEEDCQEAYIIIALHMSDSYHLEEHDIIIRYAQSGMRTGGFFLTFPDEETDGKKKRFEDIPFWGSTPSSVLQELHGLSSGIHLPPYYRLRGKRVPMQCKEQWELEEFEVTATEDPFREYHTVMQSNEGNRYFTVGLYADLQDKITGYELSTYISSGSAYGDMFTRPRSCENHKEDILQAKLAILELYAEEELEENNLIFRRVK
jgi:hypothetical protein